MSENQPLPTSSDSPLANSTDNMNSAQETSQSDADPSPDLSIDVQTDARTDTHTNDWEIAAIPGTVDANSVQPLANLERATAGGKAVANESVLSEPMTPDREGELLTLIHDLNQCNDALLSRITQLEGSLEKSQAAYNMHHNAHQTAHQQIAQLVSELDQTKQALSRQLLINENLQTEVNNCQERISQLERDCTLAAQQNLAEVQARSQAESVSRDLRSRLQRQQRYTMQFKAALEKSLTVTVRPSDAAIAQPIAFSGSTAVVMPKAQRIMPWASDNSSSFAGIDPHLESLVRGMGKSKAQVDEAIAQGNRSTSAIFDNAIFDNAISENTISENATHPEAEAKLWQNLERVIRHTERRDGAEVAQKTVGIAADGQLDNLVTDLATDRPGLLNEQSGKAAEPEIASQTDSKTDSQDANIAKAIDAASPKNSSEENDLIQQIASSFAAANHNTAPEVASEVLVGFTEPSPWGKPRPEAQPEIQLEKRPEAQPEAQPEIQSNKQLEKPANDSKKRVSRSAEDSYLPAVDSRIDPEVVPLVRSLRSQKQPGSLSNIKLPTFRNAKVASFRR